MGFRSRLLISTFGCLVWAGAQAQQTSYPVVNNMTLKDMPAGVFIYNNNPGSRLQSIAPGTGVVNAFQNPVGTVGGFALSPGAVSPIIGVWCDNIHDDTTAINNAIATGKSIAFPGGAVICDVSASITGFAPGQFIEGNGATLKLVVGGSPPSFPVIWVQRSATGAIIDSLYVDGQGNSLSNPPAHWGGNLGYSSAVVLEADGSQYLNGNVINANGNGVMTVYVGYSSGTQFNGDPIGAKVINIHCTTNGLGLSGTNGGCVDNGTGSRSIISDGYDYGSAVGFLNDIGGGASGTFNNLTSEAASDASAAAFYISGGDSTWNNIIALQPLGWGVWVDNQNNTVINGCDIKAPGKDGLEIKTGNFDIQCQIKDTPSTYSAAAIDTSGAAISNFNLKLNVIHVANPSPQNLYGVKYVGTHGATSGSITGHLEGATAALDPGMPTTVAVDLSQPITWTPTDASGAGLTLTPATATYTRAGNIVTIHASITYPSGSPCTGSAVQAKIGGFPYSFVQNGPVSITSNTLGVTYPVVAAGIGTFPDVAIYNGNAYGTTFPNSSLCGATFTVNMTYPVN